MMERVLAEAMLKTAESQLAGNPAHALVVARQVIAETGTLSCPDCQSDAWDLVARAQLMLGGFDEAVDAHQKALKCAEQVRDTQRYLRGRKNLGVTYLQMDAPGLAMACFLEVMEGAAEQGWTLLEYQALNNIAVIHMQSGNLEEARTIFEMLLDRVDEVGLSRAIAHYNLADISLQLGDLQQVALHIHRGRLAATKESRPQFKAGYTYMAGCLFVRRNKEKLGAILLEKGLRECLDWHMDEDAVRCSLELVSLKQRQGDDWGVVRQSERTIALGITHGMTAEVGRAHEMRVRSLRVLGEKEALMKACHGYADFVRERELREFEHQKRLVGQELNLQMEHRRRRQLERELAVDPLTGLDSYQALETRVHNLRAGQTEAGEEAVLFLDIDNLKPVNDSHGHLAGDMLLMQFASELRLLLPELGAAARKSGDEFIVYLPGAGREVAEEYAKQLLQALSTARHLQDFKVIIQCSIGIALDQGAKCTLTQLVELADQAMYAAKRAGRGTYMLAGLSNDGRPT